MAGPNNDHKFFVYILKGQSAQLIRYYTGMCLLRRLTARFQEHKCKRSKYTKRYGGNVYIVYLELIVGMSKKDANKKALRREKTVKKYSQKRKEKLIALNREKTQNLLRDYFYEPIS